MALASVSRIAPVGISIVGLLVGLTIGKVIFAALPASSHKSHSHPLPHSHESPGERAVADLDAWRIEADPSGSGEGGAESGSASSASALGEPNRSANDLSSDSSEGAISGEETIPLLSMLEAPQGPDLLLGRSSGNVLYGAEYQFTGIFPRQSDSREPGAERETSALQKRFVQRLSRKVDRMERLGSGPWEQDTFQIIASLEHDFGAAIVGRDFAVPASPEQSLRWFQSYLGSTGTPEGAARALDLLRAWEVERRVHLDRVVTHLIELYELGSFAAPDPPSVAYGIVDRRLVLIAKGESEHIDSLTKAAPALREEMHSNAAAILEGH